MSEKLNRFTSLMKNIFELDKSDLDFGIYRIMNIRKEEIEKFLSEGLPQKVQETLTPFASNTEELEKRVAEIEKICGDVGVEVVKSKMAEEYASLKSQLTGGIDMSGLETDVYSALYSFFNRYYDEGDFISKRRYKEGVYAIPYEGEEVKLYWSNQDQYYIKTAENFKDYTFKDGERTVHFRLVDATTEQDNNKESDDSKRTFMLWEENEEYPDIKTIEVNGNEMIIRFVFDVPEDKKKKYAEENYQKISNAIVSNYKQWFDLLRPIATSNPKKTKTLLEKHLEAYVAKNTFDYFIHKDLKGFLMRELDFYIKSEIIHLDDIDTINEKRVGTYLAKVKAIKRVGTIIIDFLAQIENFQKKLWLKKKFVVSTDWCITLDKIDESFYPEIIMNKSQLQEWIDMYAINEAIGEGATSALSGLPSLTVEFLRQNLNLIVDTKHFSVAFKERLISTIDKVDEKMDSLVVQGDNFQAIKLLENRYKKQIKFTYIDPPYNAKSSEILYKNTFKHSAWLTLMENRVRASLSLQKKDGVYCIAIDEVENEKLGLLSDEIFCGYSGKTKISVIINPSGQQGKNFSTTHEILHWFYPDEKDILSKEKRTEETADVRGFMNGAKGEGGNYLRTSGKTCFYPILVKNEQVVGFGEVCDDTFHPHSPNVVKGDIIEIYPIDADGVERKWLFGRDTVEGIKHELSVKRNQKRNEFEIIRTKTEINYKTVWTDSKYSAKEYGTNLLTKLFGKSVFSFPKSLFAVKECVYIACNNDKNAMILDYFAGAGTTGHAVLSLNRDDDGNRKFILVEMGEYARTVTCTRIKKAVYSAEWNNGKPLNRSTGMSHLMKYIRLESYEDALSNVLLSEEKHQMAKLFGEDYLINYMLDVEAEGSILNLALFKTPFNYKMKINENNETKDKAVDLVETFNYLLGLAVVRQSVIAYFKAELDDEGSYDGAVRLVKDIDGEYAFKQIEGILPEGRRALIIWRTVTDDLIASNAALDAYFAKHRLNPADREFDIIYVNGDNNLENMKAEDEGWKVNMIEIEFKNRMFEEA